MRNLSTSLAAKENSSNNSESYKRDPYFQSSLILPNPDRCTKWPPAIARAGERPPNWSLPSITVRRYNFLNVNEKFHPGDGVLLSIVWCHRRGCGSWAITKPSVIRRPVVKRNFMPCLIKLEALKHSRTTHKSNVLLFAA